MKKKYRQFIENFFLTIKSLIKILVLSKFMKSPKIEVNSNEAVILGNGPSLNDAIIEHKAFFENKSLFCVNFFAESDLFSILKPQFYVMIDPGFFKSGLYGNINERTTKLFDGIIKKTFWKMFIFIPYEFKKYKNIIEKLYINVNISIVYFNNVGLEGFKSFIFTFTKLKLGIPRPQNVLVPAIVQALNIGIKTIYLAGADHDWIKKIFISDDNKVLIGQDHFYDKEITKPTPVLLFGKEANIYELLQTLAVTFKSYFLLEEYAGKHKKAKIYNITPNSLVDAFERKKI